LSKEELEERKVELEKLEILEKMLKENEKKNFKSVCMNDNNIIAGGDNGLYYSSDNLFKDWVN
jgi:hypothetical protein